MLVHSDCYFLISLIRIISKVYFRIYSIGAKYGGASINTVSGSNTGSKLLATGQKFAPMIYTIIIRIRFC